MPPHRPRSSPYRATLMLLCVAPPVLAACREPVAETWTPTLEYSIGADTTGADTTLLKPVAIAVTDDGTIVLADEMAKELRLLDPDSHQITRVIGRGGTGPGEFVRISQLSVAPDGRLAAGDAGTRRVTVFNTDGSIWKEMTAETVRPVELAYDARGRLHVNTRLTDAVNGTPTVSIMSDDWRVLHTYGNFMGAAHPIDRGLQNQVRLVPASDGGMYVLHTYRAMVERYDATGVFAHRFDLPLQAGQDTVGPTISQSPNNPDLISRRRIPIAEDLAIFGDTLLVAAMLLPKDSLGFRSRLLASDTTGALKASFDLPRRAQRLAAHGNRLFTLTIDGDDGPRIDVYRW